MEKDLEYALALLAMVPEPAKAVAMNLLLGALLAMRRKDGGSFIQKTLEVFAGGVFCAIFIYAALGFGMSPGWVYAIAGGVAVFGVDQSKDFIARIRDAVFDKWLGAPKNGGEGKE